MNYFLIIFTLLILFSGTSFAARHDHHRLHAIPYRTTNTDLIIGTANQEALASAFLLLAFTVSERHLTKTTKD